MEMEREIGATRFFILVVDTDGENLEFFRIHFRARFTLLTAGDAEEALRLLTTHEVAVAVVDYHLPDRTGVDLLEEAARVKPGIVGILMSGSAEEDVLVSAVNSRSVWKFITKPWELEDVEAALTEGLKLYGESVTTMEQLELLRELVRYYEKQIMESDGFDIVIGQDGDLLEVMEKIRYVANSRTPVLLRGEHGTGKELLARTIHGLSDRAGGPFIKLDAMTHPENAHENEIFGAEGEGESSLLQRGRVELARGGTLFIENIERLSPGAQFRLAELLRSGKFERVGATKQIQADVRLVATTTGALDDLAAAREFREDLLDALNMYPIDIPPLRARETDIPALAQFFTKRIAKSVGISPVRIEADAMEKIAAHNWPGNLKELRCMLESAVINSRDGILRTANLHVHGRPMTHAFIEPKPPVTVEVGADLKNRLADIERGQIREALEKCGGKKAAAARLLGINRSTLYYRMKKYGIES